jgi:hypothetical protein
LSDILARFLIGFQTEEAFFFFCITRFWETAECWDEYICSLIMTDPPLDYSTEANVCRVLNWMGYIKTKSSVSSKVLTFQALVEERRWPGDQ